MSMLQFPIVLLDNRCMPKKAHSTDACFDCFARKTELMYEVYNQIIYKSYLGFKIFLPEEYEMRIRPRSGLATKGVSVHPGTIDPGYTDEVCAIVTAPKSTSIWDTFKVNFRDYSKICQIAFSKIPQVKLTVVPEDFQYDVEDRCGGFGSTGV